MQKNIAPKDTNRKVTLELLTKDQAANIDSIFPEIKRIWKDARAVNEALFWTKNWATDPKATGEIFFLMEGKKRIGITGYFLRQLTLDTAGLRWHGIIPEARNQGHSLNALKLLAAKISHRHKEIKYLSEAAEADPTDNDDSVNYFKRLGFFEWNDPEKEVEYTKVVNLRIEISKLMA